MTTSGTTAFAPNLTEIAEEAFERAGREMRSGYDLRTARRSLNFMLADWANRGVNLWTMEQGEVPLVPGTGSYTLPADTVDLVEHVIRTGSGATQADLTITRISVSTYATIPNKATQARPIQLYVDRQSAAPVAHVWPVPDSTQDYTLVYWRLRRMQDAGSGIQTQDMPFRFLPAMVAGLAYHIAMKIPEGAERIMMLKAAYDEAWTAAANEDRDKSAVRLVPGSSFLR